MIDGQVWTHKIAPSRGAFLNLSDEGACNPSTLGEVVSKTQRIHVSYLVPASLHDAWRVQKGAKNSPRSKGYMYSEGSMCCPEPRDRASRTIITGEGGATPSRFKHIVRVDSGDGLRLIELEDGSVETATAYLELHREEYADATSGEIWRRLVPEELEELNGFHRGWTEIDIGGNGMIADSRRAFLMGNALVVGLVRVIGNES